MDKTFVHRLIKYSRHVTDTHKIEPIALVICINSVRRELGRKFTETEKVTFMKILPSDEWVQAHFYMNRTTIESSLQTPLSAMVALFYVLTSQTVSLLSLEHREDKTVKMLYGIIKHILGNEIKKLKSVTDEFVNVCTNNRNQYKKIIDTLDDNEDVTKA